jgi:hypothetical protein
VDASIASFMRIDAYKRVHHVCTRGVTPMARHAQALHLRSPPTQRHIPTWRALSWTSGSES